MRKTTPPWLHQENRETYVSFRRNLICRFNSAPLGLTPFFMRNPRVTSLATLSNTVHDHTFISLRWVAVSPLGSSLRTSILILLVSTIVLLGTKRVADDSTSTTTSRHGPKTQKTEKISYPNKEGKKVTTPQVLCPEDAIYNLSILAIIAFCHRVQIKSSASSCKSDTHTSQYSHKG